MHTSSHMSDTPRHAPKMIDRVRVFRPCPQDLSHPLKAPHSDTWHPGAKVSGVGAPVGAIVGAVVGAVVGASVMRLHLCWLPLDGRCLELS